MRARPEWRGLFGARAVAPHLASWLREPGSLTARCQRGCRRFRVRLLRFGRGRSLADDEVALRHRPGARVREVLLECDGVPVIFAHTTLSTVGRGRLSCWMAGLGTRSLGSLLFSFPGFRRGPIEYRRLTRRHPLYRQVAALLPDLPVCLWARRSRHRLGGQQVMVSEVFLPGIAAVP